MNGELKGCVLCMEIRGSKYWRLFTRVKKDDLGFRVHPGPLITAAATNTLQDAFLHRLVDLLLHLPPHPLLSQQYGVVYQVPDDLIHIPSVEPHLRKLRSLDLESSLCQDDDRGRGLFRHYPGSLVFDWSSQAAFLYSIGDETNFVYFIKVHLPRFLESF
jgi:hypothetical protein